MMQEDRDSFKYEKSIRIEKRITKDDAQIFGLEEGCLISIIPDPENKSQLIERFEKLYAQSWFETLQDHFIKRKSRCIIHERLFVEELKALDDFIEKTKEISLIEAIEKNIQSDYHEYLRLEANYYKEANLKFTPNYYDFDYYNPNSEVIYAKYFLYREWLKSELEKYKKQNNDRDETLNKLINIIFCGDYSLYELLIYFSENFTSTRADFKDLTKYNHIYRYFNNLLDYNIEHRAYKELIKLTFNFDYEHREIKGETIKHIEQLEKLESIFNNNRK
ncbi:TPA: hypothetical protein ACG0AV_002599 [Elizabethkingia anophelis]